MGTEEGRGGRAIDRRRLTAASWLRSLRTIWRASVAAKPCAHRSGAMREHHRRCAHAASYPVVQAACHESVARGQKLRLAVKLCAPLAIANRTTVAHSPWPEKALRPVRLRCPANRRGGGAGAAKHTARTMPTFCRMRWISSRAADARSNSARSTCASASLHTARMHRRARREQGRVRGAKSRGTGSPPQR
jgi:hypothetical protein